MRCAGRPARGQRARPERTTAGTGRAGVLAARPGSAPRRSARNAGARSRRRPRAEQSCCGWGSRPPYTHAVPNSVLDPSDRPLADKLDALVRAAGNPSLERVALEIRQRGGPTISASYLWLLRTGNRTNPTLHHLEALARHFGVPPAYFFDRGLTARAAAEAELLVALRAPELGAWPCAWRGCPRARRRSWRPSWPGPPNRVTTRKVGAAPGRRAGQAGRAGRRWR